MALSVVGTVGVTTALKADTRIPTKLTLAKIPPANPRYYLLAGVLTDSSGHRLPGKLVQLWFKHQGERWMYWTTVRTDRQGVWHAPPRYDARLVQHIAAFRGDAAYLPSLSNVITISMR